MAWPLLRRCVALAVVLLALAGMTPVHAISRSPQGSEPAATPGACTDGQLPGGALSRMCVPSEGWNGDLIVYAHGYVSPFAPGLSFDNLTFQERFLPNIIQQRGYAFAMTTYRRNGLAILEGVQDMGELLEAAGSSLPQKPGRTFMIGFSEGALITTLFAERYPEKIDGALAACGPIGDFKRQTEYFGDFRVLFDYLFPGVLPGDAVTIPAELVAQWDGLYKQRVANALAQNPGAAATLMQLSAAPFDPNDLTTVGATTIDVLRYNVFSAEDAKKQLGGNPYGNKDRFADLGSNLDRFDADPVALQALQAYQTTGKPGVRLVTIHTTGDPIVPYSQQTLYGEKAKQAGSPVTQIEIQRYGHCSFTQSELFSAFQLVAYPYVAYLPYSLR